MQHQEPLINKSQAPVSRLINRYIDSVNLRELENLDAVFDKLGITLKNEGESSLIATIINDIKEDINKYRQNVITSIQQNLFAPTKDKKQAYISHLNDSNILVNKLLKSTSLLIEKLKGDYKLEDDILNAISKSKDSLQLLYTEAGMCNGLSAWWNYDMGGDNELRFYGVIDNIAKCFKFDPEGRFVTDENGIIIINEEFFEVNKMSFDKFVNNIRWIHDPGKISRDATRITGVSTGDFKQDDLDISSDFHREFFIKDIKNRSTEKYMEIFRMIPEKYNIQIKSEGHAIAAYRRGNSIFLYDSNYSEGVAKEFAFPSELQSFVEEAIKRGIPQGINVIDVFTHPNKAQSIPGTQLFTDETNNRVALVKFLHANSRLLTNESIIEFSARTFVPSSIQELAIIAETPQAELAKVIEDKGLLEKAFRNNNFSFVQFVLENNNKIHLSKEYLNKFLKVLMDNYYEIPFRWWQDKMFTTIFLAGAETNIIYKRQSLDDYAANQGLTMLSNIIEEHNKYNLSIQKVTKQIDVLARGKIEINTALKDSLTDYNFVVDRLTLHNEKTKQDLAELFHALNLAKENLLGKELAEKAKDAINFLAWRASHEPALKQNFEALLNDLRNSSNYADKKIYNEVNQVLAEAEMFELNTRNKDFKSSQETNILTPNTLINILNLCTQAQTNWKQDSDSPFTSNLLKQDEIKQHIAKLNDTFRELKIPIDGLVQMKESTARSRNSPDETFYQIVIDPKILNVFNQTDNLSKLKGYVESQKESYSKQGESNNKFLIEVCDKILNQISPEATHTKNYRMS